MPPVMFGTPRIGNGITFCSDGDAILITYSVEWQTPSVSYENSTFNRLGPSNDPGMLIRWEWWPHMTGAPRTKSFLPEA